MFFQPDSTYKRRMKTQQPACPFHAFVPKTHINKPIGREKCKCPFREIAIPPSETRTGRNTLKQYGIKVYLQQTTTIRIRQIDQTNQRI